MTALPTASEADRVDQETYVVDQDRESGLDIAAVLATKSERGIDTADLADRIDQAWSIPHADDDLCLAY